jgi:hypothetical protein
LSDGGRSLPRSRHYKSLEDHIANFLASEHKVSFHNKKKIIIGICVLGR